MNNLPKLLLVGQSLNDKEEIIARLNQSKLYFRSDWVEDGNSLWATLQAEKYHLIITSFFFHQSSYRDVLKFLERLDLKIPVILVTDRTSQEEIMVAINQGIYSYVPKNQLSLLPFAVQRGLLVRQMLAQRQETLYELLKEKELLSVTLKSIGDGVITTDLEGSITMLNEVAEKMTGFSSAEALGQPLSKVFVTLDNKTDRTTKDFFSRVLRSGIPVGLDSQTLLLSRKGEERYISASGSPIRDKDKQIIGVIIVFRNITRIKKVEDELRKFWRAVEHNPTSVIITDLEGNIEYINPKFTQITGYSFSEVLGLNPRFLKSGDTSPEAYKNLWTTIRSGGEWRGEFHNKKKNGELYWESASISSIKDSEGNITHYLASKEDITERKRAEEEIRQAKEAAEAANKAKSMFLANMSHEIRTPMNGIIGMTDLTLLSDLDDEQRENLKLVKSSALSLLQVINDVLDLSKIEAGKMSINPQEFSLKHVLEKIMKTHYFTARQKELELDFRQDPKIPRILVGDCNRLGQVMNNLLSNAIKFTHQGQVTVRVEIEKENHNQIVLLFSVEDTGIGISEEEMNRLFKVFSQVDGSITRKYGGSGLGLAICKKIVEMMEGAIGVKSEKGKGSKFYFTLPFGTNPPSVERSITTGEKQIIPSTANPQNILLVEDDRVNQIAALGLLKQMGHQVELANNGQEALMLLQNRPFDLVLMDIQMPQMDGLETTRYIRDKEKNTDSHLPIIALTAHALAGDREKFLAWGMDDYLSKPISWEELYACLEKFVQCPTKKHQLKLEKNILDFLPRAKGGIEGIRKAILHLDEGMLERVANGFKEEALEYGAIDIKNIVFKIQLAGRKGNWEETNNLLEKLENTLNNNYEN